MSRIHENLEYKDFVMPADITTATVCKKSGKLAVAGLCDCDPRGSMIQTEYFAEGTVPTEHCDHHVNVTVCAESGMLATDFCPNRVSGVYITGGTPGSADEPYLLSEGSTTNTCPLHTTPQQEPVNLPDINFEDREVKKDKGDKKDDKNDDKKEDHQGEPKDENESDED